MKNSTTSSKNKTKKYVVTNFRTNVTTICKNQNAVISLCGFSINSFESWNDFLNEIDGEGYKIVAY